MLLNAWIIRSGQCGYLINQFAQGYLSAVKDRDELKRLCRNADPRAKPGKVAAVASVLHKFRNVIQVGDAVVTYDPNTREYLVGEITGPYRYDPSLSDHPNVRDVKWNSRVSRDALESSTRNSFGSTLTLFAISSEAWDDVQSVAAGTKTKSAKTIIATILEIILRLFVLSTFAQPSVWSMLQIPWSRCKHNANMARI